MEKNYQPETFVDFISEMSGGMQSGVSPLLLKKNQFGVGINCSIRGGFIKTRPPIQKKKLIWPDPLLQNTVEKGFFQGAGYYRPDYGTESLIAQISGHLLKFTEIGSTWTVTDISIPGDLNSATQQQAWMWQSEKWMIIQDGSGALPIFYDGVSSRRSYGPAVVLGEIVATSVPAPTVIGASLVATLAANYSGPVNVPILFNKEFYQISPPANLSNAELINLNATAGAVVPAGTQFVVNPNVVGHTTASAAGSANAMGNLVCATPMFCSEGYNLVLTLTLDAVGVLTAGATVTIPTTNHGNVIYTVDSVTGNSVIMHRGTVATLHPCGSCQHPPAPAPDQVDSDVLIQYATNQGPSVIIGTNTSAFNNPGVSSPVDIILNPPYSGPPSQIVTALGVNYAITSLTPPLANQVILINLSDTKTADYSLPQSIYSIPELPAGRMGAYGMGCNAVCLTDGLSYVIGDVVGAASGTLANNYRDAVLKMTQNTFLAGGGNFRLPGTGDIITAMVFPPIMDKSLGQGPLQIGTPFSFFTNVVPGTDPSTWESLKFPIQTEALAGTGPMGQNSTVLVNSDVFFRSSVGIGSMVQARRDFSSVNISMGSSYGWGNTPISNEMQRILNKDNQTLLAFGSATNFDNRFFCTCAPNVSTQGVFHIGLVSLNFDLISSLQAKLPPAWEGAWTGINTLQLVSGRVNGTVRQFSFSFNIDESKIELYEFLPENTAAYKDNDETDIEWVFETPVLFNSDIKPLTTLSQLRDGEVYLSNIKGDVHVEVYYKPDFYPCWTLWREFDVCSNLSGTNANPSYRMRIGLGEPSPDAVEAGNNRPLRTGYFFQCRVVITGSCTWNGLRASAIEIPTTVFAPIEETEQSCQAIDCVVPDDLRVYSLQGLPQQPFPQVVPPTFPFKNEAVYFNNVCNSGSPSFAGTLPNWISLDAGNNRFVGAANTLGGASVAAATAAAQEALNQFVEANLSNGNITCGGENLHIYAIDGYYDGMIANPDSSPSVLPTWDGAFRLKNTSDAGTWCASDLTQGGNAIQGKLASCCEILFNDPVWTLRIYAWSLGILWKGTKSAGSTPAGTYINDDSGSQTTPTMVDVVEISGTVSKVTPSQCHPD